MNMEAMIDKYFRPGRLPHIWCPGCGNGVVTGTIVKAVAKGDTVTLVGFGTFKSSKRAARTGRNPATGAAIKIAASTVPRFTAGATFKTAVAGKKAKKK